MSEHIVIVGASVAGSCAVESLLLAGHAGPITVIGEEPYAPYNRPPLSKDVIIGTYDAADTDLPRPLGRTAPSVTWKLGVAATGLDLMTSEVALADGTTVSYDKLLIATGTRARPWPDSDEAKLVGLLTLRGRDDAERLRGFLDAGPRRVVIVGGGFMGCELAAACRKRGLPVTMIDRGPAPLASALGSTIARRASTMHRAEGVDLRSEVSVASIRSDASGRVCAVVLDDDNVIETDLVIAALGAIPNVEWLEGSGIGTGPQGVACDTGCRVYTTDMMVVDNVFTAGDLAWFPHPLTPGRFVRLEHWDNAVEMAWVAAHNMVCPLSDRRAHLPIPAFWSTQYETNIKSLGILEIADSVVVTEGSLHEGPFTAVYGRDGIVVGVLAFDGGRTLASYQRLITERAPFPPAMTVNNPPEPCEVMAAGFRPRDGTADAATAVFTGQHFTNRKLRWVPPANPK